MGKEVVTSSRRREIETIATTKHNDGLGFTDFQRKTIKEKTSGLTTALLRFPVFLASPRTLLPLATKEHLPVRYHVANTKQEFYLVAQSNTYCIITSKRLSQRHSDIIIYFLQHAKKNITPVGELEVEYTKYALTKALGYSCPGGNSKMLDAFLQDLKTSELIIVNKQTGNNYSFSFINSIFEDKINRKYKVVFDKEFVRYFASDITVVMQKDLASDVISEKDATIKSIIKYFLSQRSMPNGVTLNKMCEIIKRNSARLTFSRFKAKVEQNKARLMEYNIEYNEKEKKLYYTKHEKVFHNHRRWQLQFSMDSLDSLVKKESPDGDQMRKSIIAREVKLSSLRDNYIVYENKKYKIESFAKKFNENNGEHEGYVFGLLDVAESLENAKTIKMVLKFDPSKNQDIESNVDEIYQQLFSMLSIESIEKLNSLEEEKQQWTQDLSLRDIED